MSPPSEDKGKVLQKIMLANPEESIETMFEFCRDFRIDVNTEIINLIQSMILEWKPQVNYETNELDNTSKLILYVFYPLHTSTRSQILHSHYSNCCTRAQHLKKNCTRAKFLNLYLRSKGKIFFIF